MRYELTDHEWAAIKPMLPNRPAASRGLTTAESSFWVLRIRRTVARSAAELRSLHHLLQPLRSLTSGVGSWNIGRLGFAQCGDLQEQ